MVGRRRWRRGRHLFEAVCLLGHRRPAGRLGKEDQVLIVLAFDLFLALHFVCRVSLSGLSLAKIKLSCFSHFSVTPGVIFQDLHQHFRILPSPTVSTPKSWSTLLTTGFESEFTSGCFFKSSSPKVTKYQKVDLGLG